MTWEKLPVEIQEKMLERQVEQGNKRNPDLFIKNTYDDERGGAFTWERTIEGHSFWSKILKEDKIEEFYKVYPKPPEFVLPKDWYVVITHENIEIVKRWFAEVKTYNINAGYGIKDGKKAAYSYPKIHNWAEITYEQFKKYVLKQEIMENKVTRLELVHAYKAFTCVKWKNTLETILSNNSLKSDSDPIEITQDIIDLLLKEGTSEQKRYVVGLGISLKKNVFVKGFSENKLVDISKELFGDLSVLGIASYSATNEIGRRDLCGRSFYINSSYEVVLHKVPSTDGTIVELVKK